MPTGLYGYDIDGVLSESVLIHHPYVVISGRTFAEYDAFAKRLAQDAPVYIRGVGAYGDHQHAGASKAAMINLLGVTEFHEDSPIQIAIIAASCPNCTIVSHG